MPVLAGQNTRFFFEGWKKMITRRRVNTLMTTLKWCTRKRLEGRIGKIYIQKHYDI